MGLLEQIEANTMGPPGLDFDLPRPGIAPGNLHEPPALWSDQTPRVLIGAPPRRLETHPRRAELLEAFDAKAYLKLNPGLARRGVGESSALAHFIEEGYAQRLAYSGSIRAMVDWRYYKGRYTELGLNSKQDARTHYAYAGRFEDRVPNAITDEHQRTRLHLYQMGKVGSNTIRRAARQSGIDESLHLHWADYYHKGYPGVGIHYGRLLTHRRSEPAWVVAGVRDPVERIISGYFQENQATDSASAIADTQTVMNTLASRFTLDAWVICNWFDHRFFCGLDVYKHPFDHERGFVEIEQGPVRVFVYRQDALPELENPLGRFLGLDGLTLTRENAGDAKGYAEVYQQTAGGFRVPRHTLERLADSRYCRHFFTAEQRERMIERWAAKPQSVSSS